jgi:cyanophycinase
MCASKVAEGAQRGWIVPIGGAEEKDNAPAILRRFVQLAADAGGGRADIVVIPTASQLAATGARYERIFRELGAAEVEALDFDTRRDAQEPGRVERLQRASGVFMTGGNQLRLSTLIGGTPVAKTLRALNAAGVPVAGTSAGAAFISEHMIAFGDEGSTPVAGSVRLAAGLGLTNRFVIDQHFRQRDRLGRLLTALAYNPFAVGIGLDEDTAAFIAPGQHRARRGLGRHHRRRRRRGAVQQHGQRRRRPRGVPAGREAAHPDAGRDLQPAHAGGGCGGAAAGEGLIRRWSQPVQPGKTPFSRSTVCRHFGVVGWHTVFWLPNRPTSENALFASTESNHFTRTNCSVFSGSSALALYLAPCWTTSIASCSPASVITLKSLAGCTASMTSPTPT